MEIKTVSEFDVIEAGIESIPNEVHAKMQLRLELTKFSPETKCRVKFAQGMPEINGQIFKIISREWDSITTDLDTTKFGKYLRGGIIEEISDLEKLQYQSFEESHSSPLTQEESFQFMDFTLPETFNNNSQPHFWLNCMFAYQERYGKTPSNTIDDIEDFLELCGTLKLEYINKGYTLDDPSLELSDYIKAIIANDFQLPFTASFWGSTLAMEVIKYIAKKKPLRQWIYHNECQLNLKDKGTVLKDSESEEFTKAFGSGLLHELQNKK